MASSNTSSRSAQPVGRPKKARGAANSSDAADARWTVRGVPINVRAMVIKASENKGMTVGDWLTEAIVAYARADKKDISADHGDVSADGGANVPAIPLSKELETVLSDIQTRLGKMEAERRKPLLERIFGRHH